MWDFWQKDLQVAVEVDTKIQNAWMGHPNFTYFFLKKQPN